MRAISVAVLVTSLVASSAFAASNSVAPLPGGKPAGIKQAALLGPNFGLILLGAGVIIGGVSLAVSGQSNNGVTSPSTTASSTTGLP